MWTVLCVSNAIILLSSHFCVAVGQEGAAILAEALTPENKKVLEFLVDLTIPLPSFEQIFRRDAGGKAKKGKKGKKK